MKVIADEPIVIKLNALIDEALQAGCKIRRIEVNSEEMDLLWPHLQEQKNPRADSLYYLRPRMGTYQGYFVKEVLA